MGSGGQTSNQTRLDFLYLSIHLNMTTPISLLSLSTREAVADALYRGVLGLDTNDLAMWKSAWLEHDSSMDLYGRIMQGDELIENLFKSIGPLETTHTISNIRVNVKEGEDTAGMTASAVAQHYRPGEGVNPDTKGFLTGGLYFIDLVKDKSDGLWKMRKWTLKLVWVEGDASIVGR